tara:strand:+ start:7010 stop:7210 length:201 start_codon:yes stop_codon:yes gene_type:complete
MTCDRCKDIPDEVLIKALTERVRQLEESNKLLLARTVNLSIAGLSGAKGAKYAHAPDSFLPEGLSV